jgi:multiple sugar transport system permease protein
MVTDKKSKIGSRIAVGIFTVVAFIWISPILFTVFESLRPYDEVLKRGVVSWPHKLTLSNYTNAFSTGQMWRYFLNSVEVTVPAVLLTLFLSSMIAFGLSKYKIRGGIWILMLFTAGNLLPQQLIFIPVYRIFLHIWVPSFINSNNVLYDTQLGLILMHVAFQTGFGTFVLTNYLRTLPKEISESALVDGASVWQHYRQIIFPLLRPALASLGVLMSTWIYNDFFWSIVLLETGNKRPITAALSNLGGEFFTDQDLLAAGAVLAFLPTLILFFVLRRQFVAGLTLGSTKG